MKINFVDCLAVKKAIEAMLPSSIQVDEVCEGPLRNDHTVTVYIRLRIILNDHPKFFDENLFNSMREVAGKLLDVEIIDMTTLEFGFALPFTSHYYFNK